MPFPDLQLIIDVMKGPTEDLPLVAEVTGVPDNGGNAFLLPFVDAGVDPALIEPGRLKIHFDPDPGRPAGGALNPGVTDMRFVSLSADKRTLTLDFAQSGAGDCKINVEVNHTIVGTGSNTPVVIGSGSGSGGGGGAPGFTATLSALFPLVQEIGADLVSPTFNATYSALTVNATLADDDGNPVQNVQGLGNPLTMPFTYQETVGGTTRSWTLLADDGVNPADSDIVQATWFPRLYFDIDANPALATEADIEAMTSSLLQGNKALSQDLAPVNQYIYYAFPTAFAAAALDFQFGAFPGGFIQVVASVLVTANTPGAPAQTYQIWRSQFQQDTTITGPQTFLVQA